MRSVVLRSMSSDPPSSDQTTDTRHYSVAETLQDGTAINIRAIRADDSAWRETAQKAHEIDQNDLLQLRAYAMPRSIADFFPRGP